MHNITKYNVISQSIRMNENVYGTSSCERLQLKRALQIYSSHDQRRTGCRKTSTSNRRGSNHSNSRRRPGPSWSVLLSPVSLSVALGCDPASCVRASCAPQCRRSLGPGAWSSLSSPFVASLQWSSLRSTLNWPYSMAGRGLSSLRYGNGCTCALKALEPEMLQILNNTRVQFMVRWVA